MKKVIALLLTLMMLFTIITPVASVAYAADDNNAAVSTVEEQGEKEESKSFFEKISDFFHNIFAKIFAIFNAKCPICDKKHDDDNDTDINIGSGLDSHIHVGVTKDHSRTEATCGRNGSYTRVTTCSICGTVMNTEILTIPATGDHKYTIKGKTVRANCVEEGYTIMKCDCGTAEEKVTLEIDSTNHKAVVDDAAVSPDCTISGLTKGSHCEACGVVVVAQEEVPATGHTEKELPAVDATCTAPGLTAGKKCTVCGVITVEQTVVDAKGHSYDDGVITTAPKCALEGIKTFTCEDCGHTYTEVVSALGHTAAEAARENKVNATCTADGSYDSVVYCSVCSAQISREKVTVPATGHDYKKVVTAPTCTAGGYTTYTCSVCRDTYVDDELDELGHSFTNYVSNDDATCIVDGTKTAKCDRCDITDTVTDEDSALGHSYNKVVTAPTCTEDGYTTYTCVCGDTYKSDVVTAEGHKASEAVTENNVDATCTADGSYETVVYCSVCEEELSRVSVTVDALKHSFTNYVSNNDAKCEADGTKTAKCDRCDVTDTATDEGSALEHDYTEETSVPTCLTPGYTTYTCKLCDNGYTVEGAEALGHAFTNYVSNNDATCTDDGTKTAKCDRCDVTDTVTDTDSAFGHDYEGVVTTEPTCTTKGSMTYTCKNDATHTYTEAIDALGHIDTDSNGYCDLDTVLMCDHVGIETVLKDYKEATCTEDGYSGDKHCKKCDTIVESGSKTDKIEHSYDSVVTAPTCTEDGYTTYTCSACYDSYVSETVNKNGHTEVVDKAVDATCTESGLTEGKHCDVCKETLVAQQVVEAKGHTADEAVKENEKTATCYAEGKYEEVVYCSVCEEELSRTSKTIEKLAHTPAEGTRDNEVAATCYAEGSYDEVVYCSVEECKAELSRTSKTIEKAAHTPAEAVRKNEVAATCTKEGSYDEVVYCSVEECKAELSSETKTIDKIAHTPGEVVIENNNPPTCTADGWYHNVVYCRVCVVEISREKVTVPASHEEVIDKAVAPTCIATGLTEGKHCSVCKEVLIAQTVEPATGHKEVIDAAKAPTCIATGLTEGKHCSVCNEVLIAQTVEPATDDHNYGEDGQCTTEGCDAVNDIFETKFTGDFLYRVGNQNTVALGSLFDGTPDEGATVDVTVETLNKTAATGVYTANADWTKGTIQFSGTGVVKVTIQQMKDDKLNSVPCELYLEVVDAKNVIQYSDLVMEQNCVLLNKITMSNNSSHYIRNATLYGNGFEFDVTKGAYNGTSYAYNNYLIGIDNATLDNVKVVGAVYTEYGGQVASDYNRAAVIASGNSTIINSYVSNCASAVRINTGNLEIINSTIKGGNFANIDIRGGHVVLDKVTTINQANSNDLAADGSFVIGFGIVFYEASAETTLEIKNGITQYNNISENDKSYFTSYASTIVDTMFSNSYQDLRETIGSDEWINTGIVSMTPNVNKNSIIIPGDYIEKGVSFYGNNGYVWTKKPVAESVAVAPEYVSGGQAPIAPSYSFDYTTKNYVAKTEGSNDYCYEENGKVYISMDEGDTFNWDTSILTATKYGATLNYTVTMNGVDYTGKSIGFNTAGNYEVIYNYKANSAVLKDKVISYNEFEYSHIVAVTVSVIEGAAKNAEFTMGSSNTTTEKITIGNTTYVSAKGVTADNSKWTYITVDGKNIYYPIVAAKLTSTKGSSTYAYFPVFEKAVTITDYTDNGKGDAIVYNAQTTTLPSGLIAVKGKYGNAAQTPWSGITNDALTQTGPKQIFKWASSSEAEDKTYTYENVLCYRSPSISANRDPYITLVQYSYTDSTNNTYYYYVGYTLEAFTKQNICVTPDTLVTLADGSQARVDQVSYEDELLVWNFYDGKYAVVPAALIQNHGYDWNTVIKLSFSDGTVTKAINEHAYFDATLNEFVMIRPDNTSDYIGHEFVKEDGDSYTTVTLVNAEVTQEYIEAYSILTAYYYNFITDRMFSLTSPVIETNFFMPFEVGENMTFDAEKMAEDIVEYGLYEYADFESKIPYEVFEGLNIKYLKVAVGKGLVTYDQIVELLVSEGVIE